MRLCYAAPAACAMRCATSGRDSDRRNLKRLRAEAELITLDISDSGQLALLPSPRQFSLSFFFFSPLRRHLRILLRITLYLDACLNRIGSHSSENNSARITQWLRLKQSIMIWCVYQCSCYSPFAFRMLII